MYDVTIMPIGDPIPTREGPVHRNVYCIVNRSHNVVEGVTSVLFQAIAAAENYKIAYEEVEVQLKNGTIGKPTTSGNSDGGKPALVLN